MWLDAAVRGEEGRLHHLTPGVDQARTLIYTGGDRNQFMKAIKGTGLDEVIRAANRRGRSSWDERGAAVLSESMITGTQYEVTDRR